MGKSLNFDNRGQHVSIPASSQSLAEDPYIKRSTLSSGIKFVSRRVSKSAVIDININIDGAGSGSETLNGYQHGMAHIAEHVAMASGICPETGESLEDIVRHRGWLLNAGTKSSSMDFSFIAPPTAWKPLIGLAASVICNRRSTDEIVTTQKNLILGEWLQFEMNQPSSRMLEKARYYAHAQNPYYYPSLGTEEVIRGATRSNVERVLEDTFVANKTTITIEGNVEHDELHDHLEKFFKLPKKQVSPFEPIHIQQGADRWELPVRGTRCVVFQSMSSIQDRAEKARKEFFCSHLMLGIKGDVRKNLPIYDFAGCLETETNKVSLMAGFTTFPSDVEQALVYWGQNLRQTAKYGAPDLLDSSREGWEYELTNMPPVTPVGASSIMRTELQFGAVLSRETCLGLGLAITNDDIKRIANEVLEQPYFLAIEGNLGGLASRKRMDAALRPTL